ncbi:Gp15 family bacteriophage protein [Anaerotignum sp.]|uniref:Gp15 family bacteriophage protein n=1 Tax=Anaerotignum sp. TaxID=2039241 RepID=UPI00289C3973|nr:Gp15 family bacteriophage protein [Anaerotignum sp.]
MGLLISGLPTAIMVGGQVCRIDASYHTCLKIIMAFEDITLTNAEKAMVMIDLLYIDKPASFNSAFEKGIQFLDCGEAGRGDVEEPTDRKYSFSHDEKYIFSGVNRVLNGRLSTGEFVHWWEFVMAFMELPEDCIMSRIIYFRTRFAKGKLTKEEKRMYYENRSMFELPLDLSADELAKADEFMRLLGE